MTVELHLAGKGARCRTTLQAFSSKTTCVILYNLCADAGYCRTPHLGAFRLGQRACFAMERRRQAGKVAGSKPLKRRGGGWPLQWQAVDVVSRKLGSQARYVRGAPVGSRAADPKGQAFASLARGCRRELLGALGATVLAAQEAHAFQNAVYQAGWGAKKRKPRKVERSLNDAKKPGPQPPDLGLLERPTNSAHKSPIGRGYLENPSDTLFTGDLSRKGEQGLFAGSDCVSVRGILKECGARAQLG